MPLALGGGVKKIDDMKILFRNGADKVILNSSIYNNYDLLREASQIFGKQSIIASILDDDIVTLIGPSGDSSDSSQIAICSTNAACLLR